MAPHNQTNSFETLYCSKRAKITTPADAGLNFHLAKNQSASQAKSTCRCQFCLQVSNRFYSLRLNKQKMLNTQSITEVKSMDVTQLFGETKGERLWEELETEKTFLWLLSWPIGDIDFSISQ